MGLIENMKLAKAGFKPDEIKAFQTSGIETNEIIELSKNGYSASDIATLIEISKDESGVLQPGNMDSETSKTDPGNDGEKDDLHYKEELESKNAEIEKLKAQIEMQQKRNASQNLGGSEKEDYHAKIKEAFKGLY